jgi:glycosyltransferase involved in cell wall biosynthesis
MQFIIDITRVFRYRTKNKLMTGIDRVTMAYIQHYGPKAYALVRWCGRTWLLPQKESKKIFDWMMHPHTSVCLPSIFFNATLRPLNIQSQEPIFLLNTGHISPKHKDYEKLMRRFSVKPIFFIHDLIPLEYPEYCFPNEDQRCKEKLDFALRHAQGIITNSQATYDALRDYHQTLPPSTVAWLGSSFKNIQTTDRPYKKPYFVLNSTIEPRKNHLLILHIWRKLYLKHGDDTPHLFVIGKRGWECEQVIDMLERSKSLRHCVTELNQCSDTFLRNYIQHAQAVLMPTFSEGFGLGLVEALTLNTPVIASDLPVFREIAHDLPEYVDPIDGYRWESLIYAYTQSDSTLRTAQLKRIQAYTPPSWESHFRGVDQFLEKLLSQ